MGNCNGRRKEVIKVGEKEGQEREEEEECSVGFRFCPTDEELIVYYLMSKIVDYPLPNSVVKTEEFYRFYPWELYGRHRIMKRVKEIYFFSRRQTNRAFPGGFWSSADGVGVVRIKNARQEVIGFRKALVFNIGTRSQPEKTGWVVHEYLIPHDPGPNPKAAMTRSVKWDDWVLCKLFNTSSDGDGEQRKELLREYDSKERALFLKVRDSIGGNLRPLPSFDRWWY